ncbi:hypothetical protein Plim_3904 [Planctopirus limnophila DSM 3776]|uniref:Uncharacterized protein n=1 Tax=Planctopirus limnophila (strain ATCC 43296 / DSM 3776 / IFAM 1008 / Mu 290) TaxID=521674 RepID=D5SX93_PLAL2|nr:hypothetical protein Plim_3904 [Planctopirus limnophila DSM 3776]
MRTASCCRAFAQQPSYKLAGRPLVEDDSPLAGCEDRLARYQLKTGCKHGTHNVTAS